MLSLIAGDPGDKRRIAWKPRQVYRPDSLPPAVAYDRAARSAQYHLGARLFSEAGSDSYRYWPVLDFDDADDPHRAYREGYRFIRDELRQLSESDYLVAVSGTKGCKVFLRWWMPACTDGARIFALWLDGMAARYPTLDAGVAHHATHRGPWSAHPKAPDRLQAVLSEPIMLARDPAFCDRLPSRAVRPVPLDLVGLLPSLTEELPDRVGDWWGAVSAPWLAQQAAKAKQGPRLTYALRGVNIPAILDGAGIGYSGSAESGRDYLRLRVCRYCDGRNKAAIMLKSGWYRCFAASCEAADGLPLRKWCGDLGVTVKTSRPSRATGQRLALRERAERRPLPLLAAANKLRAEIHQRLTTRTTRAALVRATPGIGKTHATLDALAAIVTDRRNTDRRSRYLYAAPTRELAKEALQRLQALTSSATAVYEALDGRNAENCEFPRHVAAIGARGWSPGSAWCATCGYRRDCGYYAGMERAKRADVVITTHASAVPLAESGEHGRDAVIYDEDPTPSMIRPYQIDGAALLALHGASYPPALLDGAALLLAVLQGALASLEPGETATWRGSGLLDLVYRVADKRGQSADLARLFGDASVAADVLEPESGALGGLSIEEIRAYPSRGVLVLFRELCRDLARWEGALRTEIVGAVALVASSTGAARFACSEINRPTSYQPALILDAYGQPELYRRLLAAPVDLVEAQADLSGTTWLNLPIGSSRRAVADRSGPAWRGLDQVVGKLRAAGHTPILIGTYKAAIPDIQARYPDVSVYHFGRGRGIDSYGDHASVVIFGVPEPPADTVLERAALLYQSDPDPLDARRDRQNKRLWRDPRLVAVSDSLREAEAAQVAHRVRPARSARVVVTIGKVDFPDLPAPSRWGARALEGLALDGLERFARGWWRSRGWWSPAVLSPDLGLYDGDRPPARKVARLWDRLWPDERPGRLSEAAGFHHPVYGDRQAAREWLIETAKAAGYPGWRDL